MTDEEMEQVVGSEETKESTEARKELLIFWSRMIGWLATGVAAPITTFSIKFGLFESYGYQITTDELGNVTGMNVALNGWGIVSAVLIGWSIVSIISEIIDAYSTKYSFTKQCLMGLKNRIFPIAIAIAICFFLKGVIDQVIFCLCTIGISQLAAIPLNPMPAWKAKKKGVEDYSDVLTGLRVLIKDKLKEKKEGK